MSKDHRLNINGLINATEPAKPLFGTVTEHGREYAYTRNWVYPFPVDDLEEEAMNIFHWVIHDLAMNESRYNADLKQCPTANGGRKVLDIGFGNGNWCYDMAEAHPDMDIHGIDLFAGPPKPDRARPNCTFHLGVDFTNDMWSPFQENTFDFIRAGRLCGSVPDWRHLHWCIGRYLKPGGIVEHVEIDWTPRLTERCKEPPVEAKPLFEWWHYVKEASIIRGTNIQYPANMKQLLRDAGFNNFKHQVIEIPLKRELFDRWEKHMVEGLLFLLTCGARDNARLSTLEGLSLSFLTREAGFNADKARQMCADVRAVLGTHGMQNVLPVCFNLWVSHRSR